MRLPSAIDRSCSTLNVSACYYDELQKECAWVWAWDTCSNASTGKIGYRDWVHAEGGTVGGRSLSRLLKKLPLPHFQPTQTDGGEGPEFSEHARPFKNMTFTEFLMHIQPFSWVKFRISSHLSEHYAQKSSWMAHTIKQHPVLLAWLCF